MSRDRSRRAAAEFLGTGTLVVTVVGSGIMAERLAGGNTALALLGNTLPTGAMLVVLITLLGPISGAHLNPAVSLVLRLRGALEPRDLAPYLLAQAAGGLLGTLVAHLMFDLPLLQVGTNARTGLGQWVGEAVATFGLVTTILGCLRFRPEAVPVAVGLFITAAYWFTSSTSFANPAVALARAFTDSFAGIRPVDLPGFVVAQLLGALAATAVMGWLFAEPAEPARSGARERVGERIG